MICLALFYISFKLQFASNDKMWALCKYAIEKQIV